MQKKSTQASTYSEKMTSVRERTYQHIKSEVLSGSFDKGQRLSEVQLAKSIGVSRTPVREALQKLESEGLVQPLETRGFCVALDSREEMQDLFDIRAALEGFAIRLVCERITEETIEKLRKMRKG